MVILASGSATRAKILKKAGVAFWQQPCDFDEESLRYEVPAHFVYHAAMGKMRACEAECGLETPLLCADTVVSAGGKILRKAKDEAEARALLLSQSGAEVEIITCMVYKSARKTFIDLSVTRYLFDPFDEAELARYLASGEWRGKAGACMVEGFCKPYIREVVGYESCAMGLTVEKLLPWLEG